MTLFDAAVGSFALAVLVLCGLAIIHCIDPTGLGMRWPGRIALAHLAGSATMAWVLTVTGIATRHLTVVPVYLLTALFLLLAWRQRTPSSVPAVDALPPRQRDFWRLLAIVGVLSGIAAAASSLAGPPQMTNDAYWNWALKAKAMFLGGSLHPIAARCCLKPNYPILFGLESWWIYAHLHHITDRWPQILSFLFYLDIIVIVFEACRARMSSTWAWIVTALIANNGILAFFAARAMADTMLTAFFLTSAIFLARYFDSRVTADKTFALLMLLGAIQSKNEGLVWSAFALILLLVAELRWRTYTQALITLIYLPLAVAPWAWFKHRNHMTSGPEELMASAATLKLEWAMRIKQILMTHLHDWKPSGFIFLLLLCVPLMIRRWRTMSKPVLALIGLQFAAYLVVYFIVADPDYQLHFANRANSQLAPALLCTCLIGYFATRDPHPPAPISAHPSEL